jgi:HlyD family secretion protein
MTSPSVSSVLNFISEPRRIGASLAVPALIASLAVTACDKPGTPAAASQGAAAPAAAGKNVSAAAVDSPFTAIATGKVDIEGGLVDIAAHRPGVVREVLVQEGDHVKSGDILAKQIDDDARLARVTAAAQLEQAQAVVQGTQVNLAIARREYDRLSHLKIDSVVGRQQVDQAHDAVATAEAQLAAQNAAVDVAKAQLAAADYEVDQRLVRAPSDGLIVRRYANPGFGASTLQVTSMFQLQPEATRIVRAEVDERSVNAVKIGQRVQIVPEANQTLSYPGHVIRIAAVMGERKLLSDDPSQRTDERVVEVVVDAEKAPVLIAQRVFVKFLEPEATAEGQNKKAPG